MKAVSTLVLCAAMVAGPALAQQAAPVTPAPATDASGVYQVFRTTDSQLSCEQIISELNLLNSQIKAQQDAQAAASMAAHQAAMKAAAAPAPKKGGGFGGLLGAAAQSGLAGAIPGVGGLARNPLAAQAAMAAANAAANNAAQAQANAAAQAAAQQQASAQAAMMAANQPATSQSNEMQRLNRVKGLMTQKAC
jgi:hypothetical protein